MTQVRVEFAGEGSGVAELSWGQREILDAMRRQQTTMPLPGISPLPPGTTREDVARSGSPVTPERNGRRNRSVAAPESPKRDDRVAILKQENERLWQELERRSEELRRKDVLLAEFSQRLAEITQRLNGRTAPFLGPGGSSGSLVRLPARPNPAAR